MKRFSTKTAGLHLIEVVAVLSFLAVMACISVPEIQGWLTFRTLEKESKKLCDILQALIIKAPNREKELLLLLSRYQYEAREVDSGIPILFYKLPSSIFIDTGLDPEIFIHLYPSGVNSPHTIKLSNGFQSCNIRIALRGRVTSRC